MLTHLARNADSFTGLFEAASRGEVGVQYPGGNAQRDGDIDAGSSRTAAAVADDLLSANMRLETAWSSVPDDQWTTEVRLSKGPALLRDVPFRRWREVEVHHVDAGLGYRAADWPAEYLAAEMDLQAAALGERLPPGRAIRLLATDTGEAWTAGAILDGFKPTAVEAPAAKLLAWLFGRADISGAPEIGAWQ